MREVARLKLRCHECAETLARIQDAGDAQWICSKCRARVVSSATIDRLIDATVARGLRELIAGGSATAGAPCPACGRTMRALESRVHGLALEIDACRECRLVRFDAGEFEQLPRKERYEGAEVRSARDELAALGNQRTRERAIESVRRERTISFEIGAQDLPWSKRLIAWLGIPVDVDAALFEPAVATWSVAAAIAAAFLVGLAAGEGFTESFAWIPADPFRKSGLTLVTSFFLHDGWLHLVGNLWFLLAFGPGVERRLGAGGFLLLLGAADLSGNTLHALLDARPDLPCIGASGGLSALVLFYAASHPWNRFAVTIWLLRIPKTFVLPAVLYAAFWVLLQLPTAFLQTYGRGHVSALAHLGGASVGLAAIVLHRACARPLDQKS